MRGKVCLITGATHGLGLAAAMELTKRGAHVVIVGRDPLRISAAMRSLQENAPHSSADCLRADLSSLAAVRAMADQFRQRYASLDVLINNVGGTFLHYQRTDDGFEYTWALNYLSQYLTTRLLLEPLRQAANVNGAARVIGVTSSMYRFARATFPPQISARRFNGVLAYASSKRAINVFTCDMAERYRGTGITFNAITPGFVATGVASNNHGWGNLAMRVLNRFATPLDKGVRPIVHLASAPELRAVSGQYFVKFQQRAPDESCRNPLVRQQLWQVSSRMTDLPA
jgi:NAD(P)-dependent dehydrogenase (short-subunit alcohol dehydrogenase family)